MNIYTALKILINKKNPRVLEIGCNDGTDSERFLKHFKDISLVCFEPDSRAIASHKTKIKDSRCNLIESAVGDYDGVGDFYVSSGIRPGREECGDWNQSGSIKRPKEHLKKHPWCKFEQVETVPIVKLDTWAKDESVIDLIWSDVQGAEKELIDGGIETLTNKTRFFLTEYSDRELYEGALGIDDIAKLLPSYKIIFKSHENILLENMNLTKTNSELKLNLGSGDLELDGYVNFDIKNGDLAYPLEIDDDSCDEIRVSHLLEHFSHREVFNVIQNWVSKLKPNGVLKIAVPDFAKIAQNYLQDKKQNTCSYIMGAHVDENDYHKSIFDEQSLRALMKAAGLTNITEWNDGLDTCQLEISTNLQGEKASITKIKRSVQCVMSTPRLGFTANVNCMIRELAMRGVDVTLGTGAYWHQVLTRIMESTIEQRPDYLLTLDYDTWFTFDHVKKMMELMELSDADCIATTQIRRERDDLLLQTENHTLTKEQYEHGLIPIKSAHFGCTLFRVSSFEKLKKPWFKPIEDPQGGWGDGRVDADIYFWNNFIDCGLKAYLATKLGIGHIQQMVTFPGSFEDGFNPIHCYLNDVENGNIPEHILKELKSEN